MTGRSRRIIFSCLAAAAVTAVAFLPSLKNGFVNWDDPLYIQDNLKIRSLAWSNVAHIFTSTHLGGYEPLTELSYAVEYRFFGLAPFIYHLTNLVFHLCNCLLVFWLVFLLSRYLGVAFIAALLFGVHPLRVESVAWVSERKDVLYAFFFLGSLIAYLYYLRRRSRTRYYLCLALFFLSLLPKPQGLLLPLLLLLLDYFSGRKFSRRALREKIPFAILAIIFLLVNIFAQFGAGNMDRSRLAAALSNLPNAAYGLVFYLFKLILPIQLSCYYPHPDKAFSPSLFTFAPAILAAVILLAIHSRRYTRLVVFAALFFLLNTLLVLQVVPTGPAIAADRYTYVAAIGLAYLAGASLLRLSAGRWRGRRIARGTVVWGVSAVVIFYSALTWRRCGVWESGLTLWNDVIRQYDQTSLIHLNRGWALERQGMLQRAVESYRQALRINPGAFRVHNNLGNIMNRLDRLEEAIFHYREALRLRENFSRPHSNLAVVLYRLGRFEEAAAACRRALELRPEFPEAHNNLGMILIAQDKLDQAIEHLETAVGMKPEYARAHKNLGVALAGQGRLDRAIFHYREAIRYNPNFAQAMNRLGVALGRQGKSREAMIHYVQALKLDPDYAEAHNNLGIAFAGQGNLNAAIFHYREALRIRPDFPEAHNNLGVDLATQGKYEEAISHYLKALETAPGYADAHNNLGVSLARLGRPREAAFHYSEALRLNPEQPNARANLDAVLRLLGDSPGGVPD